MKLLLKKLRMTKPSKSAALHLRLPLPADALQYLLVARKPVEAESVEGVSVLLEHYYKVRRSWDMMAVGMRNCIISAEWVKMAK